MRVRSIARTAFVIGLMLLGPRQQAGRVTAAESLPSDEIFQSGRMQRIDLRLHSQDWLKLKENFLANTYYPADLVFNGQTVRNVGIRSRGSGSRRETKPGLRVDFNHYATGQTFLGLKSLVLDNLAQDASGIRETTAMAMFARLGIPAPREAHARLYVNNDYAGLYTIVESVDKDLLARVFGAVDGNVQNDGYLYEYRWLGPWQFGYLGPELEHYAFRFEPRTHEQASRVEHFAPIEALVRLASEVPAERLVDELSPHLDLEALTRFVAAQAFLAENDGFVGQYGVNNFYLYRLEDSTRHVLIAWDNDNTFWDVEMPIDFRHDEHVLMQKVMRVPALRQIYFDTVARAAAMADDATASGRPWLEAEVQRQFDLIYPSMVEDPQRPYAIDAHHRTYDELFGFARERSRVVRAELARLRDR